MPQTSRIALFVVLQTLGAIGNVVQNSNRREYDTLCTFIGLAESGIEVPDVEETYKKNYDYIQTINMSVSLPSWRSMFFKGPQKTDWHDTPASAKHDGKGYDKMWSTWLDAAQKLAQDPLPNNIKDSAALKLSPEGAAHVRPMIKALAAKASRLKAALTELNPEARKLTADAAIKTLKEAAYGKDNKKASDVAATDALGGNVATDNRQDTCKEGTGNTAARSVLATLACLCLKPSGGNPAGVCTETAEGTGTWNSGSVAPTDPDVQAIANSCPSLKNAQNKAELQRQAIAVLPTLITTDTTHGYLGSFKANNCNGAQGNGMCVQLDNYPADTKAGLAKLPWLTALTTLSSQLIQRAAYNTAQAELDKHLAAEKSQLEHLLVEPIKIATTEKPLGADGSASESPQNQKECDKHHGNKDNCTKNGCDYDENAKDGKKCKPKPGKENTATGTGEGAAGGTAASTGCGSHFNYQTACEKMNEGKEKPVLHLERVKIMNLTRIQRNAEMVVFSSIRNWH
ncbi:variant surface glycoprotein [Trypanosoma brucei equiperdum]|uniref:Variant surface glycoprotein n=1 Tax=Trypanosoma brucei equiperdum TaxID=630700 RepID=A0A3L6L492_9TRYP|nr:variant surface glycoprotein [Trypanosoma brucei equiperdum]